MKKFFLLATFKYLLICPFIFVHASIMNGTFDTGDLSGWSTEDFDLNTFNVISPSASVSVNAQQAVLSTQGYSSNIGMISLIQGLTISSSATSFSFDVKFEQTSDNTGTGFGFPDFFQASYLDFNDSSFDRFFVGIDSFGAFDPNTFNPITLNDLGNGLFRFTQSISDLAGRSGTLFFDLFDDDDGFISTATIDNVVINEATATVPEANLFLIYFLGLITTAINLRHRAK